MKSQFLIKSDRMFGFQPPADPSLAEHDILTGMGNRIQFDVFRIDQICLPGRVFGQPVFVVGSHHLSGGITAADATALNLMAAITDSLRTLTPYSGRDANPVSYPNDAKGERWQARSFFNSRQCSPCGAFRRAVEGPRGRLVLNPHRFESAKPFPGSSNSQASGFYRDLWRRVEAHARCNSAQLARGIGRISRAPLAADLGSKAPGLSAIKLLGQGEQVPRNPSRDLVERLAELFEIEMPK